MDFQQLPIQQKPIQRKYHVNERGHWLIFSLDGRVDAFNFAEVDQCLRGLLAQAPERLAVHLENADFLSIPFIKLLAALADELHKKGLRLPLIAPTEKLKRQIDIFASLDEMIVYRSLEQLLSQ